MSDVQYLGSITQRVSEVIAYTVDVSLVTAAPTYSTVILKDVTNPSSISDVSSTKLSGSGSASGTTLTSPFVTTLVDGHTYRLIYRYTGSGNTWENYGDIICKQEG